MAGIHRRTFVEQDDVETYDYYIGPSGSDSNPGTEGSPWAITAINSKRATYAGLTVGLLDGVYDCEAIIVANGDWPRAGLEVASGTLGNPTIIKAINRGAAILDGSVGGGVPSVESPLIGQGSSSPSGANTGHVTLDGLVVRNSYSVGIQFWYGGSQNGSYVPTVTGITIKNCEVYDIANVSTSEGNNSGGIRLSGVLAPLVQNCYIHDCQGGNSTEHEGYGIISFTCYNGVVEYCTVKDCAVGFYAKQISNSSWTLRYNYFEALTAKTGDRESGIFETSGGNDNTTYVLHHNVVNSRQWWPGYGFQLPILANYQLYNNTFYSPGNMYTGGGAGVFLNTHADSTVDGYNNIFFRNGTASSSGELGVTPASLETFDYNCYMASPKFANITNPATGAYSDVTSLASWRTATSKDAASITTSDPLFDDPTSNTPEGFQLQGGSPCAATGKSNGLSGGSNVDMGAWGNSAPAQIGCDFA
jgi:hypothetical protein